MRDFVASTSISVVAGALVPIVGFGLLGWIVGAWPLPKWMIVNPTLLRVLVWIVPILVGAFAVARFARSRPFGFGVLAGIVAAASPLITALTSEHWHGESISELVIFLLPKLLICAVLLPAASVVLARNVA